MQTRQRKVRQIIEEAEKMSLKKLKESLEKELEGYFDRNHSHNRSSCLLLQELEHFLRANHKSKTSLITKYLEIVYNYFGCKCKNKEKKSRFTKYQNLRFILKEKLRDVIKDELGMPVFA